MKVIVTPRPGHSCAAIVDYLKQEYFDKDHNSYLKVVVTGFMMGELTQAEIAAIQYRSFITKDENK